MRQGCRPRSLYLFLGLLLYEPMNIVEHPTVDPALTVLSLLAIVGWIGCGFLLAAWWRKRRLQVVLAPFIWWAIAGAIYWLIYAIRPPSA